MKRELDLWYELWDRFGSEGLDTWYDTRSEAASGGDLTGGNTSGVDGMASGSRENLDPGLEG